MHLKLWHKFALALIITSALTLLAALYFSQQSFKRGFFEYLNAQERERIEYLATQLLEDYQQTQSWSFVSQEPQQWHRYLRDTFNRARSEGLFSEQTAQIRRPPRGQPRAGFDRPPPPRGQRPPGQNRFQPPRPERAHPPKPNNNRPLLKVGLLDNNGKLIAGGVDDFGHNTLHPLQLNGQLVGQLAIKTIEQFSNQAEQEFVAQQNRAFLLIAALAVLLIGLLAWIFGRLLNARIQPLSKMAHKLTTGKFDQRLNSGLSDESGQLGDDLTQLATTLDQNRSARQRWIADISHELRTPLSVLRGELEALEDGVRPLEPAAVASLQTEVTRLTQLVEDLYQLSMADVGALSYQFESIDITDLIRQEVSAFDSQFLAQQIKTRIKVDPEQIHHIQGDVTRLSQLFKNLIQNTLRYTRSPGQLRVSLERSQVNQQPSVQINWVDSAPGVESNVLPYVFDRMRRGEASRSRETGGAGLGLAIAKQIVEVHNGSIKAQPATLGGLDIEITFPLD